ncbi:MAG: hypothetical protein BWK76_09905 [Desulfobulbaceae bacterium A2]|nr:MAG: hypothetical protein BWK76_09905 [Desulfobulbaceae bacterium A2]
MVVPVALAVGAVLLPVGLALTLVGGLVDKQVEAARRQAEEDARRQAAWRERQAEQDRRLCAWRQSVEEAHGRAAALLAQGLAGPRGEVAVAAPAARSRWTTSRPQRDRQAVAAEVVRQLDGLDAFLAELPREFRQEGHSPYLRLMELVASYRQRLGRGEIPLPEEVLGCQETIARTCAEYLGGQQRRAQRRESQRQRLHDLLADALYSFHLDRHAARKTELSGLRDALMRLVAADEPEAAQVELIERRLRVLRAELENDVASRALRQTLAVRVGHHLTTMGYGEVSGFGAMEGQGMARAVMTIPGGELLDIAIQPNNQLAFRVRRDEGAVHRVSGSFRAQEGRWCQDLARLVASLGEDGFGYEVKLERPVPESVAQVRVTTPEEILAEDERLLEEEEELARQSQQPTGRHAQ